MCAGGRAPVPGKLISANRGLNPARFDFSLFVILFVSFTWITLMFFFQFFPLLLKFFHLTFRQFSHHIF